MRWTRHHGNIISGNREQRGALIVRSGDFRIVGARDDRASIRTSSSCTEVVNKEDGFPTRADSWHDTKRKPGLLRQRESCGEHQMIGWLFAIGIRFAIDVNRLRRRCRIAFLPGSLPGHLQVRVGRTSG